MAKSIAKNTLFIACLTMISKILGFVRDAILAFFYGADGISDAYLVAQTIPEFAFSLVIQAIAVGYIPIYTETVKKKRKNWQGNDLLMCCFQMRIFCVSFLLLYPMQYRNYL